ncbi:site-specific integrase [Bacteroides graminisolvens]|uniref:site-specific integrase n=1 Tax=Bacteroides graminisolvens TaxID=477666 RepID=UPI0029C6E0BD|nr:site-specific integrase [Bacteroides graminisolvens]
MRKSRTTKVTLRFRMLGTGKETLYLDYYPGVENPKTGELMRREYLGLYVVPLKKRTGEPQTNKDGSYKYSEVDEETIRYAELIRNNRQNELSKAEIYTEAESELLKAKERSKGDFISYFRDLGRDKQGSNYNNWMSTLKYLQSYTMISDNTKTKRFCDIDLLWCERFRDYLLNAKTYRSKETTLSNNTAASYFIKFKIAIKAAYKYGYLSKDINADLKSIKQKETHREFLSLDELRKLVETPCTNLVLKRAALFSALTGLRHSDIRKMKWSEITETNGKYTLKYIIQKTSKYDELPISEQAIQLCGERGNPENLIFDGLVYSAYTNKALAQWLGAAGITRNVTFHCFRHTFATLQLASGTQITTIQKMLGHKNIGTTMVYAKTLEEAKREAIEKIKIL